MVRVSTNQFTTVDSTGPVAPKSLLPSTSLLAPGTGTTMAGREGALGVTFSWRELKGADDYRLTGK